MIHELKTWPEHFDNIINFKKTFEIRKNDRDYKVGDMAILRRFDPDKQIYTGETCQIYIPHILYGADNNWGLDPNSCILSLKMMFINGKIPDVQ
jgi:hypothetical protein